MKVKLEGGGEIELPEGFDSLETFISKYNEASKQAQEFAAAQSQLEKFKAWGDPETLEARLQAHIAAERQKAVEEARAQGATRKEAAAIGADLVNQWQDLTPQQQIATMSQQITEQVNQQVQSKIEDYWKQAQQQLSTATNTRQQEFDLMAKAVDVKLANPKIDLRKVWAEMSELAKATPDKLMELAMKNVQTPEMLESRIAEERAKWEEEASKKAAAERTSVLNSDNTAHWLDRTKRQQERPSLNEQGGEEKMKHSILEKFLESGELSPNQL